MLDDTFRGAKAPVDAAGKARTRSGNACGARRHKRRGAPQRPLFVHLVKDLAEEEPGAFVLRVVEELGR